MQMSSVVTHVGVENNSARLAWMPKDHLLSPETANHTQVMVAALQQQLDTFSASSPSKQPSSETATFPAPLTEPVPLTQQQLHAPSPASAQSSSGSLHTATEKPATSQAANLASSQKLAALTALAHQNEIDVADTPSLAAAVYRASMNSTLPKFFGASTEAPSSFNNIPHGVEAAAAISENRLGAHLQTRSQSYLLIEGCSFQRKIANFEGRLQIFWGTTTWCFAHVR